MNSQFVSTRVRSDLSHLHSDLLEITSGITSRWPHLVSSHGAPPCFIELKDASKLIGKRVKHKFLFKTMLNHP